MGRTYYPKNRKAKGNGGHTFDVNFAGADVLGFIMRAVGCHSRLIERMHAPLKKEGIDRPSTKFGMTDEQTKKAAKRIRELTDRQRANLYKKVVGHSWASEAPQEEFDKFIEAWAKFLETCGGYEVPG